MGCRNRALQTSDRAAIERRRSDYHVTSHDLCVGLKGHPCCFFESVEQAIRDQAETRIESRAAVSAKLAIRATMEAYPQNWHWTNGLQQERARMLLPLSWLIRVDDAPQHREWLERIAGNLISFQDASGAIREELGAAGKGDYAPPASNAKYGTAEAPLIQRNGDPVCDLLYTTNFAFLGLHEATAATQDARYAEAQSKLAQFLCRIQVHSVEHPELNGAWFRAFDYGLWDYWASNADAGWGAWAIETGWTQAWIASTLAMRQMRASLWDLTAHSRIGEHTHALLSQFSLEGS